MPTNSSEEQAFLSRLTKITEANLNNEQFGVSELAIKSGISRSQIHRKLKFISNQSVSQFIREIRLNKAKEMLLQDFGTVSEIAYKVGFGSPAYFNKCFHDKFGYAPGEFKKYALGNSEEISNLKADSNIQTTKSKQNGSGQKSIFHRKSLLVLLGILILFAFSLFISTYFFEFNPDKSIAVLPFNNLSEDISNQHFADGIMEDILTHLSGIKELKVISRTSSEKYRKSEKSLPQIAKELGVSYILEGSVQEYENKVKITIQLNDKSDKHLWADSFSGELQDIFELESEIAKKVALEVEIILSPFEIEQIEKVYTNDTEAYTLYSKGRFFWNRRTEVDVNKSIDYFNAALEQDSSYSLAYAGLADAYFVLTWWGWLTDEEGFSKSKEFAFKAISLDNNLAEPHATLGEIRSRVDWDWDFAEKDFKMAIELNPNHSTAYMYYSEYLSCIGNQTESRIMINKGIELNPHSIIMYYLSSIYYYNEGNFIDALNEMGRVLEINKDWKEQYYWTFICNIRLGKDMKAIAELKQFLYLDTPEKNYNMLLQEIYTNSGINGIILWEINRSLNEENINFYNIAKLYGLMKDKQSALTYLEKEYETGVAKYLSDMYCNYDLKFLHNEPRFIALLNKINFPVN